MGQVLMLVGLLGLPLLTCWAQRDISGTVTDAMTNETLIGASVFIKGSTRGTLTDVEGKYQIAANDQDVLVFSYVGYQSVEVLVAANNEINVGMKANITLPEVVLVGTRRAGRTSTETPVPVDVIAVSEITRYVSQVDVQQILQFAAPSFNSNRQAGADGSDHIDAATLRGLGPDQVLLLVNGKRYHPSSLVNVFGTRGRGNVGTDLNTIPTAAIERIEVLRDGAAAQYGSDPLQG